MNHISEHSYHLTPADRSAIKGHLPMLIWFTGFSGSGKSTLADALEELLISKGIHAYHLDGDSLRMGLNADLGFTQEDRNENIRRVGEVANLMLDAGLVVLAAFISPLRSQRELIRSRVGEHRFFEVHVSTPIEVCELRDVKGLYAKARKGEIPEFTGISAPYEAPSNADVRIDTSQVELHEAVQIILNAIIGRGFTSVVESNR